MNRSPLRPITDEEIRTYQEGGIACLRGMFDSDWVELLREAIDTVPGGYADRNNIWAFNDAFRELAFDSPVGEIAATLMGSPTCGLLTDIIFAKEPHSPDTTPWHHDQPYYQTQGTQLCGMWIGLDETSLENGGLEWVRGSHKWGKVFEPDPFDGTTYPDVHPGRERIPDIDNNRDDYDIVHFDTAPGDCIIDQSLILHSGGPNLTSKPRRAVTYALYGDNGRFASIPPGRGVEDTRDLGLKEGDPFPPDHELVPQIWPKRDRANWPKPSHWDEMPHAVSPTNKKILEIAATGAGTQS